MAGEARLWDFLRFRMPRDVHFSRIESLETAPGFPDVHYTIKRQSGTMELKCELNPGQFPFKDALRKSQEDWIEAELKAGGHVTLVLQASKVIYFLNGTFWKQLYKMTLKDLGDYSELTWDTDASCQPDDLLPVLLGSYRAPREASRTPKARVRVGTGKRP